MKVLFYPPSILTPPMPPPKSQPQFSNNGRDKYLFAL